MDDRRVNSHERMQAIMALESLASEANAIAAWLASAGVETEADLIEQGARSILAGAFMLERPFRPQLPPERWKPAHPGITNGPQTAQDSQPGA